MNNFKTKCLSAKQLLGAAIITIAATAAPVQADVVTNTLGWELYQIGLCMHQTGTPKVGSRLKIRTCKESSKQIFDITTDSDDDNSWMFMPSGTKLCYEPKNGRLTKGTPIVLAQCDGSEEQQWHVQEDRDWQFQNIASDKEMCIAPSDPRSPESGDSLKLLNCDDASDIETANWEWSYR